VTTQNTHHEQQHDVDTTVVESLSASEQGNDAVTAEGTLSAPSAENAQTDAETTPHTSAEVEAPASTPETTTPAAAPEEQSTTLSSDAQSEPTAQPQTNHQYGSAEQDTLTGGPEEPAVQVEQASALFSPEMTQEKISPSSNNYSAEDLPASLSHGLDHTIEADREAEVRPFTDFIEEFHQAEARFNASLQASEAGVFYAFPDTPSIESTLEEVREEVRALFPQEDASSEADKQKEEETTSKRPSSGRSRASRHGSSRGHHRAVEEEQAAPPAGESASSDVKAFGEEHSVSAAENILEDAFKIKAEEAAPPADTGVSISTETEQETPRPARRYRFDGRTTANGVTAAQSIAPVRKEEIRPTSGDVVTDAPDKAGIAVIPAAEQRSEKQAAVQEAKATENAAAPAQEQSNGNGKRRHERSSTSTSSFSKEQAATSSTQAETPAVAETPAQEIAPEDLPPLEYADLQKASSRRRRRHRSGSSSRSVATSLPATAQPGPTALAQPAGNDTPTQFTIVSGYTVGQMNQGNDNKSPFMGPEPSPARGSIITRDMRGHGNRTNVQRMPAPTFTPPARTNEAGLSSTAVNQLATAFSQAVQAQTDRLVAEFRRSTQTPANISVSLPPFPSNERVGVFVDVANLLYSARTLRMGIDFGKLLDFLRGNRRLVRAHAYCPTSPQPGDEQMFLQAVKGLGYRITTKNYKTFSSGAKKADLDLDLCMDVVRLVDGRAVDCVVLVSGDSDFMPMLDYCSDHGVRVEVAAFDEAMSATLRQSCDLFINLSMLDDVLIHA
jgi:uncharacterized LabA/DUF88 family protein